MTLLDAWFPADMAWQTLLLVLAVAFAAGWVDAVVGGGGLLQLPALLLVPGLAPVQALATNKLASIFGTATSSLTYYRRVGPDLRTALPRDSYICTDVGWNKNGLAQQYPVYEPGTIFTPGGFATMGFGSPAAIGAKIALKDKIVVALTGDGGWGQNPAVLATAKEYRAALSGLGAPPPRPRPRKPRPSPQKKPPNPQRQKRASLRKTWARKRTNLSQSPSQNSRACHRLIRSRRRMKRTFSD